MRSRFLLAAFIAVLAAGLVAGCAFGTRRIAEITEYPGRYYDRSVYIEGTVTSAFGGPFIPVQYYRVDDGSGEITVVASSTRALPHRGARVRVSGRVEELAEFGDRSIGLHLRQEHLRVERW
jgi:hypothetical protein